MVNPALVRQAIELDPADRVELIGALWDSLDHHGRPVTDAERGLLDERLADLAAHPEAERPWEEVRGELRQRHQ